MIVFTKNTSEFVLLFFSILFFMNACKTNQLELVCSFPNALNEVSAVETTAFSNLIWVIEDSKNDNILFGLNQSGIIEKQIEITNAKNTDWEDLTTDQEGNVYIGDFGNNKKNRTRYTILKIAKNQLSKDDCLAEKIIFQLPKQLKQEDFEAFFILDNQFYIFNKSGKEKKLFSVPNIIGEHEAKLVQIFQLGTKKDKITSADISANGKQIVLLSKEKIWLLSNYNQTDFFKGNIESFNLNFVSQKEGVCFLNEKTLYISDEKTNLKGGNIYSLKID